VNAAAHTVKGPSDEGTNPVEGLAHGGTTLQPAGSNGAASTHSLQQAPASLPLALFFEIHEEK